VRTLVIILGLTQLLYCCSTPRQIIYYPPERYDIWISLYGEPSKLKGILYEVKGPSIVVVNSIYKEEVFYSNIKTIKIRRENNVGKGAKIGAATGFAVGVAIGFAEGDTNDIILGPTPAEGNAFFAGVILAAYGAGIGALLGLPKRRIPINGSFVNFDNNRNKLERYSIKVLSRSHAEEPIQ